jgi:hypothetical protein
MLKKIRHWFLVSTPWPIDWVVQKVVNFRYAQIKEMNIFREIDEDTYEIPGMEGITFPIGHGEDDCLDHNITDDDIIRTEELAKELGWKRIKNGNPG